LNLWEGRARECARLAWGSGTHLHTIGDSPGEAKSLQQIFDLRGWEGRG
jgi:hypothetical protein